MELAFGPLQQEIQIFHFITLFDRIVHHGALLRVVRHLNQQRQLHCLGNYVHALGGNRLVHFGVGLATLTGRNVSQGDQLVAGCVDDMGGKYRVLSV